MWLKNKCCLPLSTTHINIHIHATSTIVQHWDKHSDHYNDVIMGTIASQITSLAIVYSTVYSGAEKNKTRQIWGIWKLRPAYSPETPNSGQKRWCFVPCDLEIWWMTLENNRAPLLCCFKLCATFHNHQWIQTGVAVQKRPISVKFDDF